MNFKINCLKLLMNHFLGDNFEFIWTLDNSRVNIDSISR
jgi:hypothetical protein